MYSRNMVDYHLIMDMVPTIARMFFLSQMGDISLSAAQSVCVGGLERGVGELGDTGRRVTCVTPGTQVGDVCLSLLCG